MLAKNDEHFMTTSAVHQLRSSQIDGPYNEALLRWSGCPYGTRDFASPDCSGFAVSREDLVLSIIKLTFDTYVCSHNSTVACSIFIQISNNKTIYIAECNITDGQLLTERYSWIFTTSRSKYFRCKAWVGLLTNSKEGEFSREGCSFQSAPGAPSDQKDDRELSYKKRKLCNLWRLTLYRCFEM